MMRERRDGPRLLSLIGAALAVAAVVLPVVSYHAGLGESPAEVEARNAEPATKDDLDWELINSHRAHGPDSGCQDCLHFRFGGPNAVSR